MEFKSVCNNDKFWCECKNIRKNVCKKGFTWNPAKCNFKNGKCLDSIIDTSVICDEIIETAKMILTKTAPTKKYSNKFYWKKGNL